MISFYRITISQCRMIVRASVAGFLAVAILAAARPAVAQTVTPSTSSSWTTATAGADTAQAVFSIATGSTSYLDLTLSNTSQFSQNWTANDILTGIVFNATAGGSDLTLTTSSATATTANAITNPNGCSLLSRLSCQAGPVNLGAEYGIFYNSSGFSVAPVTGNPTFALVLTQYKTPTNVTSSQNPLNGATPLQTSANLANTVDFGIVGANYSSSSLGSTPLVNTSVNFAFALPNGINSINISNVQFLYGISGASAINGVAEPSSMLIVASGLWGVNVIRRRRRAATFGTQVAG